MRGVAEGICSSRSSAPCRGDPAAQSAAGAAERRRGSPCGPDFPNPEIARDILRPTEKTAARATGSTDFPSCSVGPLADRDAARVGGLEHPREALLVPVCARRTGSPLHAPRTGACGRHGQAHRSASSAVARRYRAKRMVVSAIPSPAGSTRRGNAISRAASVLHPGIRSISALELPTTSFMR